MAWLSFHETIIMWQETHIHYQNHLEQFIGRWRQEIETVSDGGYPIKDGTMYALNEMMSIISVVVRKI